MVCHGVFSGPITIITVARGPPRGLGRDANRGPIFVSHDHRLHLAFVARLRTAGMVFWRIAWKKWWLEKTPGKIDVVVVVCWRNHPYFSSKCHGDMGDYQQHLRDFTWKFSNPSAKRTTKWAHQSGVNPNLGSTTRSHWLMNVIDIAKIGLAIFHTCEDCHLTTPKCTLIGA